jgi:hypothetical protein
LSIPIVVVAVPTRAEWSLDLQHCVHYLKGIHNQRIAGLADSMTHEFQKSGVDDFLSRKDVLGAGLEVRNGEVSPVRVLLGCGLSALSGRIRM